MDTSASPPVEIVPVSRLFAPRPTPAGTKHTNIAIRRWEKATGKQTTLDGDGRTFAEVAAERGVPASDG